MVVETALQFGGERTFANASGVGLGHADHPVDQGGADTSTDAGATGNGVGGGDVGVGAVVQVEQGSLSTLEQDVFAVAGGLMDLPGAVDHVRSEALAVSEVLADHILGIKGIDAVDRLQQLILFFQGAVEAVAKARLVQQVNHPDAAAL